MAKNLVLRDSQEVAIDFSFERDGALLSIKPGGGKSVITLINFMELRDEGVVNRMLIIAPLSICHIQWPSEIEEWEQTKHLTYGVIHGSQKYKQEIWDSKPDILIVNPAGLEWVVDRKKEADFPDALVVDESTEFKSGTSKRFKLLKKILDKFNHRMCLTGNILSEDYLDLFGQIYIIDKGESLGRFVTHYRKKYFTEKPYVKGQWVLKYGADEAIAKKIGHLIHHSENDDIELPPLDLVELDVKLPPETVKHYARLLKKFLVKIKGKTITGANMGATFNKLRQLLSGWVYDDSKSTVAVHTAKLDRLRALVEQLDGEPLLVGYSYKHEGQALSEALGAPYIGGDTKSRDRVRLIKEWNAGKLPVLIGHPASMGHGLNLQYGGCNVAWATVPWSFEQYDQLNRRIYRAGQTKPVTIFHIQAQLERGLLNLDEYVIAKIDTKEDNQGDFYTWLMNQTALPL